MKSVLLIGAAVTDYLGTVAAYPQADEKIRTTKAEIVLGGNCLNASVVLARLGVGASLVSKLGDDVFGSSIVRQLQQEGVDMQHAVVQPGLFSPFSYVIVDDRTKSRTIVYSPCEELRPDDVTPAMLAGVSLLVLDGKHMAAAHAAALEARSRNIPVLFDAEDELIPEPYFPDVLRLCTHLKLSAKFAVEFTRKSDLLAAMVSLLEIEPGASKTFVTATRGSEGSLALRAAHVGAPPATEVASFAELEGQLKLAHVLESSGRPACHRFFYIPPGSPIRYEVVFCFAWPLRPEELVDTTGAGDVFLGSLAYSVAKAVDPPPDRMLLLASFVAASKCKNTGIKGIPRASDVAEDLLR